MEFKITALLLLAGFAGADEIDLGIPDLPPIPVPTPPELSSLVRQGKNIDVQRVLQLITFLMAQMIFRRPDVQSPMHGCNFNSHKRYAHQCNCSIPLLAILGLLLHRIVWTTHVPEVMQQM